MHHLKKSLVFLLGLTALLYVLAGCENDPLKGEKPGALEQTIVVASDLHLLANSLIEGSDYTKSDLLSDGRIQHLDYEIVEGLIAAVNEKKPSFLILTGDLTFNGEKESHKELARLLHTVNPDTKVLVIPGNHDCNSLNSGDFSQNQTRHSENLSQEEFPEIYKDFGYVGAMSYDPYSLSYIYPLSETRWGLFLDTTLSEFNENQGMNLTGGFVDGDTMDWMEPYLKEAREKGIEVVAFTHHNLLMHNENFTDLYTIRNAVLLKEYYEKYDIRLNFSGHLHIQNFAAENGITDIASCGLLDYGNRYGIVDFYENLTYYHSARVTLPNRDLETEAREHFANVYAAKQKPEKYGDNPEAAIDFASKANAYYFDGAYTNIHKMMRENPEITEQLLNGKNTYLRSILNIPETDQFEMILRK